MLVVGRQRWPISETLRELIRSKLASGKYDRAAVAAAGGITPGRLSQIINYSTEKSSEGMPGICKALEIDIYEYLPLSDAQRRLLRALDDVEESAPHETASFVRETESRARGIVAVEKTRDGQDTPPTDDDAASSSPPR